MGWPFFNSPSQLSLKPSMRLRRALDLFDDESGAHVGMTWNIANQCVRAFVESDSPRVNRAFLGDDQFEIRNLLVVFGQDQSVANRVFIDVAEGHVTGLNGSVFLRIKAQ